ncbi:MAG: hypothetical protein AAFV51_13410, partial [Pseudomonadota bacterium]
LKDASLRIRPPFLALIDGRLNEAQADIGLQAGRWRTEADGAEDGHRRERDNACGNGEQRSRYPTGPPWPNPQRQRDRCEAR